MDFSKAFGATFRHTGNRERDGKPTRVVTVSRTYSTTQEDLWSAVTEKERISRWFAEVKGDFQLGGRYKIKGNAKGKITSCDAPNSYSVTWEMFFNVSWVSVTVESVEDGAQLSIEHEMGMGRAGEMHWSKYGPGATGVGWEFAVFGIDMYLLNDGQLTPKDIEKWSESSEGKAMIKSWANEWGKAHIVAGEAEETAMKMAQKTSKFYAGKD